MSEDEFLTIKSIWRNLKRALISSPDVQNGDLPGANCCLNNGGISNRSNSNNDSATAVAEVSTAPSGLSSPAVSAMDCPSNKKQKLNISTEKIGASEENSFMEIMKNLLSCSICLEVSSYSNQCPNGHLICITCSGRLQQVAGDLSCPVCRVSLRQGLHRSLLAEQLTSELPAGCRFCGRVMPVKNVKRHESNECTKRKVSCKYRLFGCQWVGIEESQKEHVAECRIADKTVGLLHNTVADNINKEVQMLQVPLQIWKNIVTKIRSQPTGSRMLLRQTTLNKTLGEEVGDIVFKSPIIRVPFSCCNLHGFYLDVVVKKPDNDETSERLQYNLRSENKTKVTLNYFISHLKIDETLNLEVMDTLHCHHYESAHKEGPIHELKLVSLDCEKPVPALADLESLFVEFCFISERERSERTHGILSSNDEEDTNPFITTSGSDSNVVFTLFSPSTSASRSINTSNTMMLNNSEDNGLLNEVDPSSHDEDIVITVTDNIDNTDETELREHNLTRNNHSFVAVPTVFLNPNPSMFAYSPYQLDNSLVTSFPQQQQPQLNHITATTTPEQETQVSLANNHDLPTIPVSNSSRPLITRFNEPSVQTFDPNRLIREPMHMSLFYPPQTIVTPYLSNSVPPLALRPTLPHNLLIRPHNNSNQISFRQTRLVSNIDGTTINTPSNGDPQLLLSQSASSNDLPNPDVLQQNSEYVSNLPYVLDQSDMMSADFNFDDSANDC